MIELGVRAQEAVQAFTEAMARVSVAAQQIGDSFAKMIASMKRFEAFFPPPHGFTPDYDLCCTKCGTLADEHP